MIGKERDRQIQIKRKREKEKGRRKGKKKERGKRRLKGERNFKKVKEQSVLNFIYKQEIEWIFFSSLCSVDRQIPRQIGLQIDRQI